MAEYIEREAFLERMKRTSRYFDVKFDIEEFPAADVVQVIFCKDCKHYHAVIANEKTGEIGDLGICDQPWRNEGYDVNETDYCSSAEPK